LPLGWFIPGFQPKDVQRYVGGETPTIYFVIFCMNSSG